MRRNPRIDRALQARACDSETDARPSVEATSRLDLDRRIRRRHQPDLDHVGVRHGDTAFGPVDVRVVVARLRGVLG